MARGDATSVFKGDSAGQVVSLLLTLKEGLLSTIIDRLGTMNGPSLIEILTIHNFKLWYLEEKKIKVLKFEIIF